MDIHSKLLNFVLYWGTKGSQEMEDKFKQIRNSLMRHSVSSELFDDIYSNIALTLENYDFKDKELCINDLNDLFRIIKLNKDEYSRYITVFNALIESEYGSSLNGFSNAHIKFHGNYNGVEFNQDIKIGVEKSQSNISKDFLNYFNFQNVIYIDSPSILENNHPSSQYHLRVLERKLKKIKNPDEIYSDEFFKDLNDFKRRIDELIGGNFEYVPSEDVFIFKKDDETFSMENTASGLKQLATIQLLLDNNELTKNSFLILDEPEINLHFEWQVKLAKLLVLLVKELNIYLYINSHSPQFIEALEVFSVKYGIINESKFYLSKKLDNNKFKFEEIDYDNLVTLYNNLGDSYDIIDEIRAENIFNKLNE